MIISCPEPLQSPLLDRYFFNKDDITTLADTPDAPKASMPTRVKILKAMKELVRDAAPGDSFVVLYSGHGGRIEEGEEDEDEDDEDRVKSGIFHDTIVSYCASREICKISG